MHVMIEIMRKYTGAFVWHGTCGIKSIYINDNFDVVHVAMAILTSL